MKSSNKPLDQLLDIFNISIHSNDVTHAYNVAKNIKLALMQDVMNKPNLRERRVQELWRVLTTLTKDAYNSGKPVLASDIYTHITESMYELLTREDTNFPPLGIILYEHMLHETTMDLSRNNSS